MTTGSGVPDIYKKGSGGGRRKKVVYVTKERMNLAMVPVAKKLQIIHVTELEGGKHKKTS